METVPKDGVMCVMRMARFLSPLSHRSSRFEYLRRAKYKGRCPLEVKQRTARDRQQTTKDKQQTIIDTTYHSTNCTCGTTNDNPDKPDRAKMKVASETWDMRMALGEGRKGVAMAGGLGITVRRAR